MNFHFLWNYIFGLKKGWLKNSFLSCCLSVSIDIDIEIFIWFCLYFSLDRTCNQTGTETTQNENIIQRRYFSTNFRILQNHPEDVSRGYRHLLQQWYFFDICSHLSADFCLSPDERSETFMLFYTWWSFYILIYFFSPLQATHNDFFPPLSLLLLSLHWGRLGVVWRLCSLLPSTGGRRKWNRLLLVVVAP